MSTGNQAAVRTGNFDAPESLEAAKAQLRTQYGENRRITNGNYDSSLAVKCVNGTFVGRKTGKVISYKGIPFVGRQPVGELRWKAPVEFVPDDGVYEAYYNAKSSCQNEACRQKASPFMSRARTACISIYGRQTTDPRRKSRSWSGSTEGALPREARSIPYTTASIS